MLAIGGLLFFVSGFAALQYQVVWQRLLGLFSGADIQSATIIVAAFMAGLGCGSLTGGYLSDRLSRRGNLLMFAFAELAVGVFGFFSAALYYDVLYVRFGYLAANSAAMPAILFLSLLCPTFLMGTALPLLARALTFDTDGAARVIGTLYGSNTFGAAMGALLTTWWLIPQMGLAGSLHFSVVAERGRGDRRRAARDSVRAVFARNRSIGATGGCPRAAKPGHQLAVSRLGGPLRARRISGALARIDLVQDHRRHDEVLVFHVWDAARRVPGGTRARRRRRQPACEAKPPACPDVSTTANGHWDLRRHFGDRAARGSRGSSLGWVAAPIPRGV